jgi:hypothetical protein
MELILAILGAGPAGYFSPTRRRGLLVYLALWVVVFPIQTVVVFSLDDSGNDPLYWVVNAAILAGGLVLNTLGWMLRQRRRAGVAVGRAAAP